MAPPGRPVKNPENVEYSLMELSRDLRSDTIDHILLEYTEFAKKSLYGSWTVETLLNFVSERRTAQYANLPQIADVSPDYSSEILEVKPSSDPLILELLTRLELETQVLAYLSRFQKSSEEVKAAAYELLEFSRFVNNAKKAPPYRIAPRLECFRMAQKIRNEFGCSPSDRPTRCSSSFEDLFRLGRDIEEDEPVDFLNQCLALKLVDRRQVYTMYSTIKTHAQLASFDYEISCYGLGSSFYYGVSFELLSKSKPAWPQLRKYLSKPREVHENLATLFGAVIPREKLDEALRTVIKHVRVSIETHYKPGPFADLLDITPCIQAVKLLLDRGARLDYRSDPFEGLHLDYELGVQEIIFEFEHSSLEALMKLRRLIPSFPIREFFPYICCPLMIVGSEVKLDKRRPVGLSCLSVKSAGTLRGVPLPTTLRPWVRMHQEMPRALIAGKYLTEDDFDQPAEYVHYLGHHVYHFEASGDDP